MILEDTRNDFMQSIYDMFSDDETNDRANQIIELPCKVGDTVYFIKLAFSYLFAPKSEKIRKIELYDNEIIFRTNNRAFTERKIGKTVFLTKEAAKQALRGRENK